MDRPHGGIEDMLSAMKNDRTAGDLSRATSPGAEPREAGSTMPRQDQRSSRNRPRTYPYFRYLPYTVEDEQRKQEDLTEILKYLYIAIEAGDFSPGAIHWTRELRNWLSLKFDPTREQRVKLVKLYYDLALAPGIDPVVLERFASMFMLLTKSGVTSPCHWSWTNTISGAITIFGH